MLKVSVLLALAVTCIPAAVTVATPSVSVSPAGGSGAIAITADQPWNAASSSSWLTVSPSSGTGSQTLTYTFSANSLAFARMATINISGVPFVVNQLASNGAATPWGLLAAGTIRTIAGNGTLGFSGDGAMATSAQISYADGVAVDSNGNLYIPDSTNRRVRKVNADTGIINTIAGTGAAGSSGDGGPAAAATFQTPRALAVDAAGNLYIADDGAHRVRRIDAVTGIVTTIAGTGIPGFSGDGAAATSAQLNLPYGLAVDSAGTVFIADLANQRIRKVTAATGVITTIAGTGAAGYNGDGIAAISAQLSTPIGVFADAAGNVYIADAFNYRIRKVTAATGLISTLAGTGAAGSSGDSGPAITARLDIPRGVVVDGNGDVFIADSNNQRIRKITAATGIISTIAGTGVAGFSGDNGPAAAAKLYNPNGLALDGLGRIYIADTSNNRIRFVNANATTVTLSAAAIGVSSAAGTGSVGVTTDPPGAFWSATSTANWLIPITPTGAGAGTLSFSYQENTGYPSRSATINVNGVVFPVTQSGATLSINSTILGPGASSGPINLVLPSSTAWTATSSDTWLTVSPASGTGNATLTYTLAPHTGANGRTATITAAGKSFTVVQAGSSGAYTPWGVLGYGQTYTLPVGLNKPYGVAADGNGNVYIADTLNNLIRKVDATTRAVTTIAGGGSSLSDGILATGARLLAPQSVAVDPEGNVFIAETANNRIRRVDRATGIISTYAGGGATLGDGGPATSAQLNYPYHLAMDASRNIIVADANNHRIRRIDAAAGTITTVAGTGTSGFSGDGGLAVSAKISNPVGVAVDALGNVYLSDYVNQRIRRIDTPTGIISTIAGNGTAGTSGDNGPATAALINGPRGLAVDGGGNLYFAEFASNRVRRIAAGTGIMTTVTSASSPEGVGVDASGNLYIADSGANSIRFVDYTTPVVTVNGTGASVPFTAGQGSFGVTTVPANSFYFASSSASWLTVSSNTGAVIYNYAGNTSIYGRTAIVTINDKLFRVTQTGASLSPPAAIVGPAAASGTFQILAPSTATWTASSSAPWLTVSPNTGTGTATLTFTYSANSATAGRTAAITAAGQTFTLTQVAANGAATAWGVQGYGVISTIAGTGEAVNIGDGGPANLASVSEPSGVAVDANGNIYIADTANSRVRKIAAATRIIDRFAGTGTIAAGGDGGLAILAQLNRPRGVSVDATGNVYIADTYNSRIRKVDASTGIITTVAGTGVRGLSGDGGPAASAQLYEPWSVVPAPNGDLYIADSVNQRIRRVAAATGIITTLAASVVSLGLAHDSNGNLYVSEYSANRVRKLDPATGAFVNFAGTGTAGYSGDGGPAAAATLNNPRGVAVDAAGNVYIAEFNNTRIRVVNAVTGIISTITGNGTVSFSGDGGPAALATLNRPDGVAVAGLGNVFIADTLNNRIRFIDYTSATVTLSGSTASAPASGGTGTVTVASIPATNTAWIVTGAPAWVAITTAPGQFTWTAAVNNSVSNRAATLTIADKTFTLTQAGATGTLTLSANSATVLSTGGSGAVTVTPTPADYTSWTVTGAPAWLTVTTSGNTVSWTAAVNTSASRTAILTVGDKTYSVVQSGVSPTAPTLVSVAPSSSTANPQLFTITARDPQGFADINRVYFLLNDNNTIPANSCHGYYDRAANAWFLYNDALTATVGSLQNSQCAINAASSAVTGSATDLLLNLSLTRQGAYANGAKNLYFWVTDNTGDGTGWLLGSAWTVGILPQPPVVSNASPSTATAAVQTFAVTARDANGFSDISRIYFLLNTNPTIPANVCHGYYDRPSNTLALYNDALTSTSAPVAPGSPGTISNSQCAINVAASAVTAAGQDIVLTLNLTRQGSFAYGLQNLYFWITDAANTGTGWVQASAWTTTATGPQPPTVAAASPGTSSLGSQVFTVTARDANGFADISRVYFLVNPTTNIPANSCHGYYDRPSNRVYLYNDALTATVGSVTPGAATVIQNFQCAISGAATSVTASGTDVVLNLSLTRQGSYISGNQNLYWWATDSAGAGTGWILSAAWNVPATPPQPAAFVSATPTSSSVASQTFTLLFRDPNGYNDIGSLFVVGASPSLDLNSCSGRYIAGVLYLFSDDQQSLIGPLTPGQPGTLQNTQCSIDGATSSATAFGTDITLTLNITRKGAYATGIRNLFVSPDYNTTWVQAATWAINPITAYPPTLAASSPSTSTATTQTFSITASDPDGAANINRIYFVINTSPNVPANTCHGYYQRSDNTIYLYNNATTAIVGSVAPGNNAIVQNSQCAINGATTSVTSSGNSVVLNLSLTRQGAYSTGAKNLYIWITDNSGYGTGWLQLSNWTL